MKFWDSRELRAKNRGNGNMNFEHKTKKMYFRRESSFQKFGFPTQITK